MDTLSRDYEPRFSGFHDLMPRRVREILLVSSYYDAFVLEEDGRLSEKILSEYEELNLRFTPRIKRVSTGEEALQALKTKTFDMVITMTRLLDMDPIIFGEKVKQADPSKPVILLTYEPLTVEMLKKIRSRTAIDKVFYWTGDSRLLIAIIKSVEDTRNAKNDLALGIQAILIVEDSPRFYSQFLPLIYTEIMTQTRLLISDSVNDLHRLLRMRARPKILLAETYEEAIALYETYKTNLLAIISDIRFPHMGRLDPQAGFTLTEKFRSQVPDLAILLQSSEPKWRERVLEEGMGFIDKNSERLLLDLHHFIMMNLGFGDFIFRLPDGKEIARAMNLHALIHQIKAVPDESIIYHSTHNHFSIWLRARTEFEMAEKLRPRKLTDFQNITQIRDHLIGVIDGILQRDKFGVIQDFEPSNIDPDQSFIRLGSGSLGGKARGVAFMSSLLGDESLREKYKNIEIKLPRTFVICSEVFEEFLEINHLQEEVAREPGDDEIINLFLRSILPDGIDRSLQTLLERFDTPLAIRSSSLLEDCQTLPFAGIYKTFMLPNNHPDISIRLTQLRDAIKLVYASTFLSSPREFVRNTFFRIEEEKMAVIIQEIAGNSHGDIFYPTFSGVAQSFNFYPFAHLKSRDGIAFLALGLGKAIVEGEKSYRFSPRYPRSMPPFASPEAFMDNSQAQFWALDLSKSSIRITPDEDCSLTRLPISRAEEDGSLTAVASTYSPQDGVIRDTLSVRGPRVITFAPILKHNLFPLDALLDDLLTLGTRAFGTPVEMEFAVTIPQEKNKRPIFTFLQVRPMVAGQEMQHVLIESEEEEKAVIYSTHAMGNGTNQEIRDIITVVPEKFEITKTRVMAEEIGRFNARLVEEKRPYILIGLGRLATSDPYLGIPTQWHQISGARLFIEVSSPTLPVEPSQGSHFFQNMLSLNLGYMAVDVRTREDRIDWDYLMKLPVKDTAAYFRHIRLDTPLSVKVDGQSSRGVVIPSSVV